MDMSGATALRTIGLDVKAVARKYGADLPQHPLLPEPVLALTRYWMALGGKTPPAWSQFNLMDIGEAAAYLTILRCDANNTFTFTFMGSAVSTVLGQDLTGESFTAHNGLWGAIDWYRRCKPVAEIADLQVLSGSTHPAQMSAIDFTAADFPFMDDAGGEVSYIVGVTVARLN